jgi:1-deoxy-D-xylulose-5-phosphate reductoisomerase
MTIKGIAVLGSTGSIGVSTLDVLARHPDRYRVVALTAHRQVSKLFEQCLAFSPEFVAVGSAEDALELERRIKNAGLKITVGFGQQALDLAATHSGADIVMAAIVGAAGLRSALAAVERGKTVLLANKEALVMAGPLFMRQVAGHRATLLPIDSEHNAVFQSLPKDFTQGLTDSGVRRIILTASGGPFREADPKTLEHVTPEQAVAHPNWSMGQKISVDSATMMNKGLEVIEAHFLFGVPAEMIDVVIHPQSVIHSMVEYIDGSVIAELGNPDMRTPIAHALGYPERLVSGVGSLDLLKVGRLEFSAPDLTRFPCLGLAYQALRSGAGAPAVLNAANEIAVDAFLKRRISFTSISSIVEETLMSVGDQPIPTLDAVFALDSLARSKASGAVSRMAG